MNKSFAFIPCTVFISSEALSSSNTVITLKCAFPAFKPASFSTILAHPACQKQQEHNINQTEEIVEQNLVAQQLWIGGTI